MLNQEVNTVLSLIETDKMCQNRAKRVSWLWILGKGL